MRLASILDLGAAAPLHAALSAARGQAIAIDAGEVERVGGLCLQVLLAAKAAWAHDAQAFAIIEPSTAFVDGIARMGATQHLEIGAPA